MENWTNALLCQADNTNVACKLPPMCLPDEPTITRRETTGCRACLPDLQTRSTHPENLPPKEKVIVQILEKANKCSYRVDLRGKLRIPSANLRPIQLVFSCPFYRSSTLTSRSSTLRTLIFPRKNILIKRMMRVLKIS